ncbi:bifunctional 2-polyprenyl-6-hydroxyphenol methylase/3-demethylubiquinol 3-O-methyltransferase UbiG [Calothrix sp. PCC 7507]|uniref:class I SAM-dependent methyltransferase n=1 Tax=Calothrix sp. PCC 7507 TaxID=99598 RepID=UPI00029EE416|nr:class I SAM-dependent methyltransferase [Calothrix sp. PCC 7507]AFY35679.1 Methyltransferase type 11 [Calothrix sp. PCC 7507]
MFKEADIRPKELLAGQAAILADDINLLLKYKNDFISVACPACCSTNSDRIYEKYGIQFVICRECETVYANPRPRPEHLEEYYKYSKNYAYWNKYIFPASEATRREKIFKPRVQKVIDICHRFNVSTDTILEVGTGFGIFCEEIKKTGVFRRVLGVEPTPDLAETCRHRGIEVIEKPIEQIDFGNSRIDVIVNFEVIEHLFSPKEFVLKCYEFLVEGGIFILTCPNVKGFDIATLGNISSSVDNEHINLFNIHSLTILLESCGFEVIERQTPGQLDAELVRNKIISGEFDVNNQPFLKQILMDEWESKGEAFQKFLSENQLSSNMLLVARKP